MTDFWSMPMTAGRTDIPVGVDELGNVMYQTPSGVRYVTRQQAAPQGSVVKGAWNALKDDPWGTAKGVAAGAIDGIWQGISAPGRAAAGEPVTYGDVAATAMDWALPQVPGIAGAKYDPNTVNMGIRAYHGSPHDFDKFSMDKIGTGEGAQAYGHGLYFAEAEDVAKGYRNKLSKSDGTAEGNIYDLVVNARQDPEKLKQIFKEILADDPTNEVTKANLDVLEADSWRDYTPPGKMYEVEINADPDDFLDWDAPLSEQPPAVRNALQPDPARVEATKPRGMDALTIRQALKMNEGAWADIDMVINNDRKLYEQARDSARRAGVDIEADDFDPGEWLANKYREYVTLMAPTDDASRMVRGREQELAAKGIPGIKYYDGNSRADGTGTRNYVVFDDNLIDIIRKYGWAGTAPLFANALAQPDEPQY